MSTFHIPVRPGRSLTDAVRELPSSVASYFRRGFSLLARVPEPMWSDVLKYSFEIAHGLSKQEETELSSSLGVDKDEVTMILVGAAYLAALAATHEATPNEFIATLTSATLVSDQDGPVLNRFITSISTQKSEIKSGLLTARLGSEVLPSLRQFNIVVDLRLSIERQVNEYVPIAIAMLGTDATNGNLWFQLTKKDVQGMIADLEATLRKMELAQKWGEALEKRK